MIHGSLRKFYSPISIRSCYFFEHWTELWKKNDEGLFAQKYKVNISQKMVADALKTVAPNYYARRQTDTARQTNTIPYRADYFGHKLHVDQNEKLEMYGVVHVVAIDGHSAILREGQQCQGKTKK